MVSRPLDGQVPLLNEISRFVALLGRMDRFSHLGFFQIPELEASTTRRGFQIHEVESLSFDNQGEEDEYIIARFVPARKD
jgi:hypothetical protein